MFIVMSIVAVLAVFSIFILPKVPSYTSPGKAEENTDVILCFPWDVGCVAHGDAASDEEQQEALYDASCHYLQWNESRLHLRRCYFWNREALFRNCLAIIYHRYFLRLELFL